MKVGPVEPSLMLTDINCGLSVRRSLDDDSDGQSGSGSESEHEHGSGGEGANGGESGGDGEHEGEGDSEIEMGEEQGDDRGSESGSEDGNEGEHASGGDSEGGGESEGGREHESGNGDGSESGGDGDNNGVASGWLEIVAARAIASGCEIFNTYGEYSNAKLLQKVSMGGRRRGMQMRVGYGHCHISSLSFPALSCNALVPPQYLISLIPCFLSHPLLPSMVSASKPTHSPKSP